jgi:hypothetical protein
MYFVTLFEVGTGLSVVASIFYISLATLIIEKNVFIHSTVWALALLWNAYLLKTETLGQFGDDDGFWAFRYSAVWILVLSICFFLLQAFRFARSKKIKQKYRVGLKQFRALGRTHKP